MLLTHPLSLAALGLLFVNDQVLRRLSPSWWTGKLSDLAWLFFIPFAVAAVISWLVPGKNHPTRHEKWTFILAYGLTGFGFTLVKTIPAANILATRIFEILTNTKPSLLLDPGDLLALPALAFSAWFWYSTRNAKSAPPVFPLASPRQVALPGAVILPGLRLPRTVSLRRILLLPLATLVLLADAAAPDPGITCFSQQGSQIYAKGGYDSSYVSQDGGVTWETAQPGTQITCAQKSAVAAEEWLVAPGSQPNTRYRYIPDQEIQVSSDGGKTWKSALKFYSITEPERIYYLKSRQGSPMINPGPFDAIADPASGNMLFAMGQQGVLVHTTQGQWLWSKSGAYQRLPNFPTADALAFLLGGMVILAIGTALLIYSTLALRWTKHWLRITVLILAWLAWLGLVVIFPPATAYSYSDAIAGMGILALAVLIVPLTIEQTVRLARRSPRDIPRLLGFSLAGGLLFLLPYVFWVYNTLPGFLWATIASLVLAAAFLVAGWLRQWNRITKINREP